MALGLAFRDPATGKWETADQYLAGNLRLKLRQAEAAAGTDPSFRANVEALKRIQPRELPPEDIRGALGAGWIPGQYVEQFGREVLGLDINAEYVPALTRWLVTLDKKSGRKINRANRQWGTRYVEAIDLLDQALNGREPSVTRRGRPDLDETLEARDRQQQLKERFEEWLWRDPARAKALANLYNQRYNAWTRPEYDGSYLTDLPGVRPGVSLRPHQQNALARGLRSPHNLFLVHGTGFGKTRVLVCLAHELRRLGKRRKIIQVVPNHRLTGHGDDFLEVYPGARLLRVASEDLAGGRYNQTMAKMASEDWDAIIMTHSAFERIRLSKATQYELTRQKLAEFAETIRRLPARATRKRKELEKQASRFKAQLDKIAARGEDPAYTWESIKCDQLMIDEVHRYKNLPYSTRRQGVLGLSPQGSGRALDAFMKVRCVQRHCPSCGRFTGKALTCPQCGTAIEKPQTGNITFASATPLDNTIAEMWAWQQFLQPDLLAEMGCESFDAWAAQFSKPSTLIEIAPVGTGYREATRFAGFTNANELSTAFSQVADVRLDPAIVKLPLPKLRGGKPKVVVSPLSDRQRAYLEECERRAARVLAREVSIKEDNYLKIMNDATKAALDFRLVDPTVPDDPRSKVNLLVRDVLDTYRRTTGVSLPGVAGPQNLAQLIFLDTSVPKKGFNLYDDIKAKLAAGGILENEVAFIHDAKNAAEKQRLFDRVNLGQVRVLLASTPLAGEGANLQRLAYAIRHLDAVWEPKRVIQRNGRINRQGNLCPEYEEVRYVTEGGDAYRWQAVERKALMGQQILTGEGLGRTVEDIDAIHPDFANTKALASGDPTVQKRVELQLEIQKLQTLEQNWFKRRAEAQQKLDQARAESRLLAETAESQPARQELSQRVEEHQSTLAEPFRHADRLAELKQELRQVELQITRMNRSPRSSKKGGAVGRLLRSLFGR